MIFGSPTETFYCIWTSALTDCQQYQIIKNVRIKVNTNIKLLIKQRKRGQKWQ